MNRRRLMVQTGDDFVGLCLPSGLLWAKGNIIEDGNGGYKIGEPTDYGAYFSWGNINPHFSSNGSRVDDPANDLFDSSGAAGNSYSTSLGGKIQRFYGRGRSYSQIGGCDAGYELLGNLCCVPTAANFEELVNNTDSEWVTLGGIYGRKFMKKSDHSVYIFFPAAGECNGNRCSNRGTVCYYQTSSANTRTYCYAAHFDSNSTTATSFGIYYHGLSVRVVSDQSINNLLKINYPNDSSGTTFNNMWFSLSLYSANASVKNAKSFIPNQRIWIVNSNGDNGNWRIIAELTPGKQYPIIMSISSNYFLASEYFSTGTINSYYCGYGSCDVSLFFPDSVEDYEGSIGTTDNGVSIQSNNSPLFATDMYKINGNDAIAGFVDDTCYSDSSFEE